VQHRPDVSQVSDCRVPPDTRSRPSPESRLVTALRRDRRDGPT
jgi:hypothetical protein